MAKEKLLDDSQEEVVALEEVETELEEEEVSEDVETEEETFDDEFEELEEELEEDLEDLEKKEESKENAKVQSKAENAKYAQKRREAEAKAKETENELSEILKPYNVKSYEELSEIFDIELDKKTLERLKEEAYDKGQDEDEYIERYMFKEERKLAKAKEKAKLIDEKNKRAVKEKVDSDISEFKAEYPDIDPIKLMDNELFMDYADGKLGKKSLAEVYKGFNKIVGNSKIAKEAKRESKATRSTVTAQTGSRVTLTTAQQKAFDEWNARYPHNKFKSVAEFLRK